ncbi:hypothetical protein CA264_14410 [Pontibacter actiniarum]|uniref:Uncharacterized protein n=1 Tax=Pontibacter actiniarum TaxID=323450 RepID=A0A1X9YUE2_9BACT|nr:hypothetical protein CA264_14410 [Pontibacter actiniarum]
MYGTPLAKSSNATPQPKALLRKEGLSLTCLSRSPKGTAQIARAAPVKAARAPGVYQANRHTPA